MKIKIIIFSCFCFLLNTTTSKLMMINMASPVQEGTLGTRPFISEHVAIEHENLHIKIDENFEYATFNIEYIIDASKDGINIPLLFYASDYYKDFIVTIDEKPIKLKKIEDITNIWSDENKTKFADFDKIFNYKNREIISVEDSASHQLTYLHENDFLYFDTNISKGKHSIKVSYIASRFTNSTAWIKESSFRYALSPAKYWKSFGTINITIDASDFNNETSTNLGTHQKGDLNNIAIWSFSDLPTDTLQIDFKPKISSLTQKLINISPFYLSLIFTGFFIIFHFIQIKKYRKTFPKKRFSSVVIIGGILIPILFSVGIFIAHQLINSLIGEHASNRASYGIFFLMLGFPIYLIGYLLTAFLFDFITKNNDNQ